LLSLNNKYISRKEGPVFSYKFGKSFKQTLKHSQEIILSESSRIKMAELFDKQAAIYLDARPRYPSEWFSMLASLTPDHSLAWDAGTGNGQAAIDVSIFSLKLSKYIEI
jgi:hypothetical protein